MADEGSIRIRPDGPYVVKGIDLLRIRETANEDGRPDGWEDRAGFDADRSQFDPDGTYALCRCGASADKPFCDGSHRDLDFDGTEIGDRASRAEDRKSYGTEARELTDHESICAHAGFCVRDDTSAWKLAEKEELSAEERELLEEMAHQCPSGRLVLHEPPEDPAQEPSLSRRIGVVDDGPLYVQGGIPLQGADGDAYEVRNRMTLCRCGASDNKPWCDGSHAEIDFEDA